MTVMLRLILGWPFRPLAGFIVYLTLSISGDQALFAFQRRAP
jgi:hypothetical protein